MPNFIIQRDYEVLITAEQFEQITTNPQEVETCLNQSEEEVKEYLRHRYDTAKDMAPVIVENDPNSVTATAGTRIYDNTNNVYYLCTQDATAQPLNDGAYFTPGDNRNQKLVQITTDVFLYHIHTRLNPRNVPQHRKIRYDGDGDINKAMSATKWLLMVQKGTITPNLTPALDENGQELQTGQSIIYGSSPRDNRRTTNKNSYYTGD